MFSSDPHPHEQRDSRQLAGRPEIQPASFSPVPEHSVLGELVVPPKPDFIFRAKSSELEVCVKIADYQEDHGPRTLVDFHLTYRPSIFRPGIMHQLLGWRGFQLDSSDVKLQTHGRSCFASVEGWFVDLWPASERAKNLFMSFSVPIDSRHPDFYVNAPKSDNPLIEFWRGWVVSTHIEFGLGRLQGTIEHEEALLSQ